MPKHPRRPVILFLFPLLSTACAAGATPPQTEGTTTDPALDTDPTGEDSTGAGAPLDGPSWHEDIAPLVHGHCRPCHDSSTALSGIDLLDYESASAWSSLMSMSAQAGTMPPWGAADTESCAPPHAWADDPRLSEEQLAMLAEWAEAGAPQGDPALAAPLPDPIDAGLPGANLELVAGSWVLPAGGDDDFRCHPIPLGLDEPQWMTGLAVEPTNATVLHHAVFFYDPQCDSVQNADESGSYRCFGAPGIPNATMVGAWTPGGRAITTPENSGVPLAAGACLVMQAHYHPHPTTEQTDPGARVSMRLTDREPELTAQLVVMGAMAPGVAPGLQPGANDPPEGPSFVIPAGASMHTEQLIQDLPIPAGAEVRVWGVLPHEHIAGHSIELSLLRAAPGPGESAQECVVAVPQYDFDWQRTYVYDVPLSEAPIARAGDRLRMDCTYDNSMANASLVELLMSEQGVDSPDDVQLVDMHLGEGTLDEMCVGIIGVAY